SSGPRLRAAFTDVDGLAPPAVAENEKEVGLTPIVLGAVDTLGNELLRMTTPSFLPTFLEPLLMTCQYTLITPPVAGSGETGSETSAKSTFSMFSRRTPTW